MSAGTGKFAVEAANPEHLERVSGNMPYSESASTPHSWAQPAASNFRVRGPAYMHDSQKMVSERAAFELMGCDMFRSMRRVDDVGGKEGGFVQRARAAGHTDLIFIVNIQVPTGVMSESWINQVSYWTPRREVLDNDSAFAKLLDMAVNGDNEFRKDRFKLVPLIVEGPWLVRRTVPQKPALVGNKLTVNFVKGEGYFELDVDVASSVIARRISGVAASASTSLVFDMGWTIEGREEDELPERLLGAVRLNRVNLESPPLLER